VNQHPHHRIDFEAWSKKIESKLVTSEQFFKNRLMAAEAAEATKLNKRLHLFT